MTIAFDLDENDYLQGTLFFASKNRVVKRAILKWWLIAPVGILLVGLALLRSDKVVSFALITFAVIQLAIYPLYIKERYKQRYKKLVAQLYKTKIGKLTIVLNDEMIELYRETASSKFDITEIEEIIETGDYFFARLSANSMLVFPKNKISQTPTLRDKLKQITTKLNVAFNVDLNWRWKDYVEI